MNEPRPLFQSPLSVECVPDSQLSAGCADLGGARHRWKGFVAKHLDYYVALALCVVVL